MDGDNTNDSLERAAVRVKVHHLANHALLEEYECKLSETQALKNMRVPPGRAIKKKI